MLLIVFEFNIRTNILNYKVIKHITCINEIIDEEYVVFCNNVLIHIDTLLIFIYYFILLAVNP